MNAVGAGAHMNAIYRRQRHIYDATRKYFLLGRDRVIDRLAPPPRGRVLEIGCGTGRNLVRAARRYPTARLYGVDVSSEMLASASLKLARACLTTRVRLAQADATAFDPESLFAAARFERVFVSYTLSMIPNWPAALDRALTLLTPDGELHIVDFGDQGRLPGLFRRGLRRWLAVFDVTPCDALERDLRRRAVDLDAELRVDRPYRRYAQYAVVRLAGTDSARATVAGANGVTSSLAATMQG